MAPPNRPPPLRPRPADEPPPAVRDEIADPNRHGEGDRLSTTSYSFTTKSSRRGGVHALCHISSEFVDEAAVNLHRNRLLDLNHPILASIDSIQVIDDFLVIDYVIPTDTHLEGFMRESRMPNIAKSVFAIALAEGLQHLHTNEFRHGDLGLSQIYLTRRLEPVVVGHGISSVVRNFAQLTDPRYSSPEIFDGGELTDLADSYSYGVILASLVANRAPYVDCVSPVQVTFSRAQGARPTYPTDGLSPKLHRLIERCLDPVAPKRPTPSELVYVFLRDKRFRFPETDPAQFTARVEQAFHERIGALEEGALRRDISEGKIEALYTYGMARLAHNPEEALRYIRQASDLNYPPAESGLGILIREGRVPANDDPIPLFRRAARHHDPRGSYCFALALANGEGVPKNEWKAAKHFLTVANFDESKRESIGAECYLDELREMIPESQYRYALFRQHGIGPGTAAPDKDAVTYFRLAAEKGHVEAQFQLGLHLEQGIGADRDLPAAMALYERPAAAGNPRAQNRRAFLLETVNRDLDGALLLYSQAAAAGHTQARFNRGRLLERGGDPEGAAALFRLAADDGHATAAYRLALLLVHGAARVPRDIDGALHYYGQAAAAGIVPAIFNLARLYSGRYGVPANLEESLRLYKEAADKGHPKAVFRTAVLYEEGIGVPASLEFAYQYYQRAAQLPDPDGRFRTVIAEAKFRAAMSIWKGFGTNIDAGQAMLLFRELAEAGHVHAAAVYAQSMLEDTTRRDKSVAVAYCRFASDNGDYLGDYLYGRELASDSPPVPHDVAQALVLLRRSADKPADYIMHHFESCDHGFKDAQYEYGCVVAKGDPGRGIAPNVEQAMIYWRRAADQHHPQASKRLAKQIWADRTPANRAEAFRYLVDAAKVSDRCASFLGMARYKGEECPRDFDAAEPLLARLLRKVPRRKPKTEYRDHQLAFGDILQQKGDFRGAYEAFKLADENHHPDAPYYIGLFLEFGRIGPRDFRNAMAFYRRAIDGESTSPAIRSQALYRRGRFREMGRSGNPRELEAERRLAREDYQRSNTRDAQYRLARMYVDGIGRAEAANREEERVRGLRMIEDLANGADPHSGARMILGLYMYNGIHMFERRRDPETGKRMILEAAEPGGDMSRGDPDAQAYYGIIKSRGDGGPPDYETANRFLKAAADHDVAIAQRTYAYNLERGYGVQPDLRAARHYYQLAIDQGDAHSMFYLAKMISKSDERAAFALYEMAANQGLPVAQLHFADLLCRRQQIDKAVRFYEEAAAKIPEAQFRMGEFHEHGQPPKEKSLEKAVRYYTMAADAGYFRAQLAVGRILIRAKDDQARLEGRHYLEAAGRQGSAAAFATLAEHHERSRRWAEAGAAYEGALACEGSEMQTCARRNYARLLNMGRLGTPGGRQRAACFYTQASEMGDIEATLALAKMYELGRVDGLANPDYALRVLSDKAQKQGNAEAEARFGAMVRDGLGCKGNVPLGLQYIQASERQRSGRGMAELGWCYERGLGVHADFTRALALYKQSAQAKCGDGYFLWGCAIAETNEGNAGKLWKWGAKRLHPGCCWKRGDLKLQRGKRTKGLALLADAADQGLVDAQLQLARASSSDDEQLHYLRDAMVSGSPEVQWQLGRIFQNRRDGKLALRCFKKAAETVPAAVSRLAEIYENGDVALGIVPDEGKARFWKGRERKQRAAEQAARDAAAAGDHPSADPGEP